MSSLEPPGLARVFFSPHAREEEGAGWSLFTQCFPLRAINRDLPFSEQGVAVVSYLERNIEALRGQLDLAETDPLVCPDEVRVWRRRGEGTARQEGQGEGYKEGLGVVHE